MLPASCVSERAPRHSVSRHAGAHVSLRRQRPWYGSELRGNRRLACPPLFGAASPLDHSVRFE